MTETAQEQAARLGIKWPGQTREEFIRQQCDLRRPASPIHDPKRTRHHVPTPSGLSFEETIELRERVDELSEPLAALGLLYLMTSDDPFWERTKEDGWPSRA